MTERYAYALKLTDLNRSEFENFVSQETVRLEAVVAHMESQTVVVLIEKWRRANGGADPDTATLISLRGQARNTAEQTVLATHVWEGYRRPGGDEGP